jgi:hypothetical protein
MKIITLKAAALAAFLTTTVLLLRMHKNQQE